MLDGIIAYALSKKYTDNSIAGTSGVLAGKNCTIISSTHDEEEKKTTVVFGWYDDDDVARTTSMVVYDGADSSMAEMTDVTLSDLESGQILVYNGVTHKWENEDAGAVSTKLEGLADVVITDIEDGQSIAWDAENEIWVNGEGGGGGSITEDVTANTAVGAIASGDVVASGTSVTDFVKQLLIKEIAPTISFSASSSGVKEVGTSVTPTLTVTISSVGTGTPVSIAFYSGSTLLDTQTYVSGTSSYSFTMTDAITTNTTVKGILTYTKSDSTSGTIEKTASYTFVMASYYGAVSSAPTTSSEITALTKSVKNTKALTATFTLSNQKSCYCYPASFGNLSSVLDGNGFQYINSYTKTSVTVDDVAYNVYTLTDPVTASGFKQVYA